MLKVICEKCGQDIIINNHKVLKTYCICWELLRLSEIFYHVWVQLTSLTVFSMFYISMFMKQIYKKKFKQIVDTVTFRPRNEVCGLSRNFAFWAAVWNYDCLLEYFPEQKKIDPIAECCFKEWNSFEFKLAPEVLNDVLSDLASLSLLHRRRV